MIMHLIEGNGPYKKCEDYRTRRGWSPGKTIEGTRNLVDKGVLYLDGIDTGINDLLLRGGIFGFLFNKIARSPPGKAELL